MVAVRAVWTVSQMAAKTVALMGNVSAVEWAGCWAGETAVR